MSEPRVGERDGEITRSLATRAILACLTGLLMIVAYVLISTQLRRVPAVQDTLLVLASVRPVLGLALLWVVLLVCLLLPFSSAALFILLGLDLFGPFPVFWTALSAGFVGTSLTYFIGLKLTSIIRWQRLQDGIEEAHSFLEPRTRMVGALTFVIKAVPNPLYDAWGYACGMTRVPFRVYLIAAVAGGLLPLTFLCFGVERFL